MVIKQKSFEKGLPFCMSVLRRRLKEGFSQRSKRAEGLALWRRIETSLSGKEDGVSITPARYQFNIFNNNVVASTSTKKNTFRKSRNNRSAAMPIASKTLRETYSKTFLCIFIYTPINL